MNEEQSNKPSKGTWDRLGNKDSTPKITFEVNIPQTLTFLTDVPEERESTESEGDVYYRFSVKQDNVEKFFSTSAWTLLAALKAIAPLKNKTVTITKKLIKGKQNFEVSNVSA